MDYGTNINLHLLLQLHLSLYISAILDNYRLYHIPRTSNKKLRERTRGTSARKNCEGLTNTHKISRLLQYGFSENLRWMNHLRTSQISDAIETWTFLVEALWSSHTQKSIETTPLKHENTLHALSHFFRAFLRAFLHRLKHENTLRALSHFFRAFLRAILHRLKHESILHRLKHENILHRFNNGFWDYIPAVTVN